MSDFNALDYLISSTPTDHDEQDTSITPKLVMSLNARFPIEITVKIAQILYAKEYFVELETVVYIFPELNQFFSHKIPTIALIDDDQYDKFSNFIHTRKRPYDSQDLFIILQQSSSNSNESTRLKSKCYMILGSKCYQKLIPREFYQLKPYVTLVENKNLIKMYYDKSYKCYEMVCDAEVDPNRLLKQPIDLMGPCRYAFHVVLFLMTFLKFINPRLLRFETYSGKNDLSFEWTDLHDIYTSFISLKFNQKGSQDQYFSSLIRTDRLIETPKCSFEFIKDINQLSSLYQCLQTSQSGTEGPDKQPMSFSSMTKWLKTKLGHEVPTPDIDREKIAFFHDLENFTVDKILSKGATNNSFISIDCSKSISTGKGAYFFVKSSFFLKFSKVQRRKKAQPRRQKMYSDLTDDEVRVKSCIPEGAKTPYLYYIDIFYKDFCVEKLQSADITVYNPHFKSTTFMGKNKSSDDSKCSTKLNLKDLEYQINRLMSSIKEESKQFDVKIPQNEPSCLIYSRNIMETIVQQVTNSIESEDLSKEQPLRLRVFDNNTQKINEGERYEYLKEWFRRKLEI